MVLHPDWADDIHNMYLQDLGSRAEQLSLDCQTSSSVVLQMKRYEPDDLAQAYAVFGSRILDNLKTRTPAELEPPVPVDLVPVKEFSDACSFDFVSLAKSPTFTPNRSDDLISVIAEYIEIK